MNQRLASIMLLAGVCAIAGCENAVPKLPVSRQQYDRLRATNPQAYTDQTVRLYNLRRAMDSGLDPAARVDSLELAIKLGGDDPTTKMQMLSLLEDPKLPPKMHQAVMEVLLREGDPAVAGFAVKALENPNLPPNLRDALLLWLTQNARPEVLAQVVKLWAQESGAAGPNEARYRQVVERLSRGPWDEALVNGINTDSFFAKGSALELLIARQPADLLKKRILQAVPATDAMAALREFARQFDYLPRSGAEFLSTTVLYKTRPGMIPDAAVLAGRWKDMYGYRFNIRDFHLLSCLSRDPSRRMGDRPEMVMSLARAFTARKHVKAASQTGRADNFGMQVESLSLADLWRLTLLNEMLERSRVQGAIKIMADRDRADTRGAWGGLVVYDAGQAEAKLYPSDTQTGADDLHYIAGRYVTTDGHDALCRFNGHFEKADNSSRAGPDEQELRSAHDENYCGLILTQISAGQFAACYYTPEGVVVSMGTFPFATN